MKKTKKLFSKCPLISLFIISAVVIISAGCTEPPTGDEAQSSGNGTSTPTTETQTAALSFTAHTTTGLTAFREGPTCSAADIDGDDDIDLLITGEDPSDSQRRAWLYENDGAGNFTKVANVFAGVEFGASAFVDVDNDDDMDLCIAGATGSTTRDTSIYLNNGAGVFSSYTGTEVTDFSICAMAFGDLDKDGYPDLVLSGKTTDEYSTEVYLNSGVTTGVWNGFSSASAHSSSLPQARDGSLDFGDVDADGDLDLLITGSLNVSPFRVTAVYLNNGDADSNGSWDGFTDSGETLTNVDTGNAVFADLDGDNDLDIVLAGSDGLRTAGIYINNGSGGFTEDTTSDIEPLSQVNIITGDPDADGDTDLVISGYESDSQYYTRFYRNDGSGTLAEEDMGFTHIGTGEGHFFDVDGDLDLDVINCGVDDDNTAYAELWLNNINS